MKPTRGNVFLRAVACAAHMVGMMVVVGQVAGLGGCGDGGGLPLDDAPDLLVAGPSDDITFAAPSCSDRVKNGAESDVDCGGGVCPPCPFGKGCSMATDCASKTCNSMISTCSSCGDGAKNGSETDVDCGGSDCAPCAVGLHCAQPGDCDSQNCSNSICINATSCNTLKKGNPMLKSGTYRIDPDGPGGADAFAVWCDMSLDGGGWTVLPLRFTDTALWSITQSGSQCTSAPAIDKNGSLLSFQNASAPKWAYMSVRFVPPIPVTQVYLNGLIHSTATACNNMDILYTVTPPSTGDETAEGWYFADKDLNVPLGHTFAAGCMSPSYNAAGGNPPECSMDTVETTPKITREILLSKPAAGFNMVVVQGCGSSVCDAGKGQAERFLIKHPSTRNEWQDGILVR